MIVTGQSAEALTQPVLFPTRYACILDLDKKSEPIESFKVKTFERKRVALFITRGQYYKLTKLQLVIELLFIYRGKLCLSRSFHLHQNDMN